MRSGCDTRNGIQEHLGFVQEGILREMIFTKSKHYDEYGQTKDEFEKLNMLFNQRIRELNL